MKKILAASVLSTAISAVPLNVLASSAEDSYFYIGGEFGISEPVVKAFKYTSGTKTTKMRLKQSRIIGGRVGYSFYPNIMIELSGTHQPKYRLGYKLPAHVFIPGVLEIPETPDITKVSSNVFMLNLIYEFEPKSYGLQPYAILGAGVAQISIRPKDTIWNPPAFAGMGNELTYFRVKKTNQKCLAWQFGGGVAKNLTDNLKVDFSAKFQVVNDIKIKYDIFDKDSKSYEPQDPIKKTIGVGEFTLGFTYKLPF